MTRCLRKLRHQKPESPTPSSFLSIGFALCLFFFYLSLMTNTPRSLQMVGWYGIQLLPPVDTVTVGEVCRCEMEFSFNHVLNQREEEPTQVFRLEFQLNDRHWMLSGHNVKYFCSGVSLLLQKKISLQLNWVIHYFLSLLRPRR